MKKLGYLCLPMAMVPLLVSTPSSAQQAELPKVMVTDERPRAQATAISEDIVTAPASVTVLDHKDLSKMAISTYGDIFRNISGVDVNDYGQGLVAYEVKMRGFDSGHGRDIAFSLDGMPLNVTGSQHTNGYADLAQIIPETVDRVEIVRGPFSIYSGNHAVGGSVQFYTDNNPASSIKMDVDSFGRTRLVPIIATQAGPGRLLLALDATKGKGYNKQSDLERANFFARYMLPLSNGLFSARVQLYDAKADAPGFIDYDAVRSGEIGPRSALSPGIGDKKKQNNVVLNFRSNDAEGTGGFATGWQATLYGIDDDRSRWTNFDVTHRPIGDPVNLGGENDKMKKWGFDIRKSTMFGSATMPSQLTLGVQFDNENIHGRHFATDAWRNILSYDTDRNVHTRTVALYGQYQIKPLPRLKVQLGARYDRVHFKVGLRPADSGFSASGDNLFTSSKGKISPKLGLAYALTEGDRPVELFANFARGLKTPYPFGDYARMSADTIQELGSSEIGVQGSDAAGSSWRAAAWSTRQSKEALFNAGGIYTGSKRTRRDGFDIEGKYAINQDLRLFGNISKVRARFTDQGVDKHITGVPDWTALLGIEGSIHSNTHHFDWSLGNGIVGSKPIREDNTYRTKTYHRTTARIGYANDNLKGANFALAVTHYSNPLQEATFDYGARFVAPKPRWKAMLTAQYKF